MSAPTEGLMKLIGLTKQKREVGPLLQEYVRNKYGVENMAAFTRGTVPGVEDKEALYQQWIEWIEAGEMHHFTEAEEDDDEGDDFLNSLLDDDDDDGESGQGASEDRPYEAAEELEDDIPVLSDEAEAVAEDADEVSPQSSGEHEELAQDEEPEPVQEQASKHAESAEPPSAGASSSSGSLDELVMAMIRQELATQVKPEDLLSEEWVREIVREELRTMLRTILS